MTCDFQQCGILTSVNSDGSVQPPFNLRNSNWCSVSSLTFIEYSSDKQGLRSYCAYAQAGLSHCWSHISHCWKSHVAAQINLSQSALKCSWLVKQDFPFHKAQDKRVLNVLVLG